MRPLSYRRFRGVQTRSGWRPCYFQSCSFITYIYSGDITKFRGLTNILSRVQQRSNPIFQFFFGWIHTCLANNNTNLFHANKWLHGETSFGFRDPRRSSLPYRIDFHGPVTFPLAPRSQFVGHGPPTLSDGRHPRRSW